MRDQAYDSTASERRAGISVGRDQLDKSIEVLAQTMNQLADRLDQGGVLRVGIKAVNERKDGPSGTPGNSPLADVMTGAAMRLAEVQTRAADLLSRLDV